MKSKDAVRTKTTLNYNAKNHGHQIRRFDGVSTKSELSQVAA